MAGVLWAWQFISRCQLWHRLHFRQLVRRAPWLYFLCDAAGGVAVEWNVGHQQEQQKAISAAFGDGNKPVATLLKQLLAKLRLPLTLQAVGVTEDQLGDL